jgi:hypothetical protein
MAPSSIQRVAGGMHESRFLRYARIKLLDCKRSILQSRHQSAGLRNALSIVTVTNEGIQAYCTGPCYFPHYVALCRPQHVEYSYL